MVGMRVFMSIVLRRDLLGVCAAGEENPDTETIGDWLFHQRNF